MRFIVMILLGILLLFVGVVGGTCELLASLFR
jgi:hypothetical protein